ncbi:MAG: FmdB family zinc ribbon protein [Dehalococcoidia bacterium]
MPTYVYKCDENGHVFELIQGFNDEPGADCPTCGSASSRQITAPTVIYKGSGFYTTDYGSGSSSTSTPSKSSSSNSESSSDSGSDSSSSSDSGSSSGQSHSNGGGHSHSHGAGSHTH